MLPTKRDDDDDDNNDDLEDIGGLRTIGYVMRKLDCSRSKVYRLLNEGRLEQIKFDSSTRVTERSIQEFMRKLVKENRRRRSG